MEWYLPFTMISGVGLIVLSTSNILLNLNGEIHQLEDSENKNKKEIIPLKLSQLKLLNNAMVLQYIGLFLFLATSLIISLSEDNTYYAKGTLILGVLLLSLSLLILIIFAYRSTSIRQKTLRYE